MDPLEALLEQIRQERGVDLNLYKPSFIRRRLDVRMRTRNCPDYVSYGRLLRREPQEYGPLLDALTINLTRFFRDGSTFQAIEEKVLPSLLQRQQRRLRIWSAGCAAGEEPYSLAIMLRELLGPQLSDRWIEILATDVDESTLDLARQGRYNAFSFRGIDSRYQPWIERYFTPGPERHLDIRIREMVTFRQHDLSRDPPPQNLDLILCRNVLIYFERELQGLLYEAFHRALRAGGVLVLGKTEVLPMAWSGHFIPVDLREHIFRRAELEIYGAGEQDISWRNQEGALQ